MLATIDAPRAEAAPPAAPPPVRPRRLRRKVLVSALAVSLAGSAYGGYRLAQMFGYLLAPSSVGTLPLVEVPAPRKARSDLLVVLLSADGGWARLDQELAAKLSDAGYPVVGWNSLRYFVTPRTPALAADDLTAVMRTYERKWHRPRVLLVGYSFGADVLPLVVQRLAPGDRAHVAGMVLLSLWSDAEFQFKPSSWVGKGGRGIPEYATLPATRALRDIPILCIGGDHDPRSVCKRIGTPNVTARTIVAGHSLGSHVPQVYALMRPVIRTIDD